MSLFKARDWWSTTSGFEEFHDLGCLCVGNIDNNPSGYGNIITQQVLILNAILTIMQIN